MSTEVDSKVVQMQFDNARFEQNIRTTLNSLDTLNRKLEFTGANKGLDELSTRSKSFDISSIAEHVESLSNRFSNMGIIGMTALQNITNSALNMGKKIGSTVLNLVKQGGINRALNIEQAKFQIEGLGYKWADLEKQISYGVKDTAYGLDSAAKVASQLLASGVDFDKAFDAKNPDKMARTLRAISGVAAMTNSTYDDMGRIFTTVAGNGRLMTEQLQQFSGRGLNAAAALRDYFNSSSENINTFYEKYTSTAKKSNASIKKGAKATEENIRTMVTNGAIDFETFSKAMDQAFGAHAKEANKTFTGALSNVKAALSRFGAKFATPGLESLRDIFNGLIPVIDGFSAAFDPVVNLITKGMKGLSDGIVKFLGKIDFTYATEKLTDFANRVEDTFNWLKNNILSDKNIIKPSDKNFGLDQLIADDKIKGLSKGTFAKGIKNIKDGLYELKEVFANVKNDISGFLGIFKIDKSQFTSGFVSVTEVFSNLAHIANIVYDKISRFINVFLENEKLIGNIKDTFSGFVSIIKIFWEVIKALFDVIGSDNVVLYGFADGISTIIEKIFGFTGTIGRFITEFAEYLKTSGSFSKMFEKLRDTISIVAKPIIDFAGKIKAAIKSLFSSDESADDKDPITDKFEKLDKASEKASSVLDKIKSGLEKFMDFFKSVGEKLKDAIRPFIDSVKELVQNTDFNKFFSLLNQGLFSGILIGINQLVRGFGKKSGSGLTGITDSIKSFFNGLSDALHIFEKKETKADALKKVAISIGILAASMWVISSLDTGKLVASMGAISVAFGELFGMMAGFGKLGKSSKLNFDSLSSITTALLKISAAMLIMSIAFKKLGSMDWNQYAVATAGLTTILGELTGALLLLSNFNGNKEIKSLMVLSFALTIMSGAFKSLGSMKWGEYAVATAGMSTVLGELIGATLLLSHFTGSEKATGTLLGLAFTLTIMAGAFKIFGSMNWSEYAVATAAMSTVLSELVAATLIISKFKGEESAGSMIIIAASLAIMAKAFKVFGSLKWSEYAVATAAMSTVLTELVAALIIVSKFGSTGGAVSLLLLSTSMIILAKAFSIFGSLSWSQFAVGIAAMSAALAVLLGAAAIASLGPVTAGLLILSGAVALIGAGCLMAGVGITAFAAGLAALVAVGTAGLTILTAGLLALIALIPAFMEALGVGLVTFLDSFLSELTTKADSIVGNLAECLLSMLEILVTYVPQFVEKGGQLIAGILRGIADNMQDITEAGLDIIINFLNGVAEKSDDLVAAGLGVIISLLEGFADNIDDVMDAGTDVIIAFLNGVSNNLQKVIDAGWDLIIDFINGLSDSIEKHVPELEKAVKRLATTIVTTVLDGVKDLKDDMVEKGKNAIQGFINGLKDSTLLGRIFSAAKSLGKKSVDGAAAGIDAHSPSREFGKLAGYAGEGYIIVLSSYYRKVEKASQLMGEKSVSAMSEAISRVSDIITSDMSLAPTITPVLDTSNISAGVRSISGMFNGQAVGISANIGAINALMAQRQSANDNSDVVNAVNKLRRSIEDNPSNVYNIDGITYDDGSAVSDAIGDLYHAIRVQRRV